MARYGRLVNHFPRKFLGEVSKTEAAHRPTAHLTERIDVPARASARSVSLCSVNSQGAVPRILLFPNEKKFHADCADAGLCCVAGSAASSP